MTSPKKIQIVEDEAPVAEDLKEIKHQKTINQFFKKIKKVKEITGLLFFLFRSLEILD